MLAIYLAITPESFDWYDVVSLSITAAFLSQVALGCISACLLAASFYVLRNNQRQSGDTVRAADDVSGGNNALHQTDSSQAALATWWIAPGVIVLAGVAIISVRFTWYVVATMWLFMAVLLVVTLLATRARMGGKMNLPPVPVWWISAVAVGIGGWSMRELRVEAWSIPLGLTLVTVGFMAHSMRNKNNAYGAVGQGYKGAWPEKARSVDALLWPGILATLGPSTMAIGTDPLTWRAVLVVLLAATFMLIGARQVWRSPLIIGMLDLFLAILLVFVARRDAISAIPWLLTLAATGAVLVALAVYLEAKKRRDALAVQSAPSAETR
jgi:hypothetical protein